MSTDNGAPTQDNVTQPEYLDPVDLEFHRQVLNQVREANSAVNVWANYLAHKHKLTPMDSISEDGAIVRVTIVEEPQQNAIV